MHDSKKEKNTRITSYTQNPTRKLTINHNSTPSTTTPPSRQLPFDNLETIKNINPRPISKKILARKWATTFSINLKST